MTGGGMMGATGFDPAALGLAGTGNPDVGTRIISPSVKLSEYPAVGVHPTFTVIEPAPSSATATARSAPSAWCWTAPSRRP